MAPDLTIVLTTAPDAYDYGYTIDTGRRVDRPGGPYRVVMIPNRSVDYQTARYQSGFYAVEVSPI
jgi:hypothetical protein